MKSKIQKFAAPSTFHVLLICYSLFTIHYSLNAQQYGWKNLTPNLPDFPWDTIWNSQNEAIVCGLEGPSFISDNEGWLVSVNANNTGSSVLYTTDGGETWEVSTVNSVCTDIQMLNATTGYTGGYGGTVWKTTDGGHTWTFHWTTTVTISDIEFPPQPSDTGYVSGMDGHVAWITPTGITPLVSGIVGHVETMSFPVSWKEGWFEGEGWGMIRHFKDGQWNADQIHISGYFNAIDFVDNQNGWAAGDRIIHTTDGHTWVEQTNHPELPGELFSVFFLNNQEGWAVGSVGQVLKTTDGGETWIKEELGTEEFFTGVQFTSSTNGYLVGGNKAIYKYCRLDGVEEHGSVEAWGQGGLEVFPNPTKGVVSLQSSVGSWQSAVGGRQPAVVEIVDLYGIALKISPLHLMEEGAGTLVLDLTGYPAGVYFLRINSENEMIVKKIIKL